MSHFQPLNSFVDRDNLIGCFVWEFGDLFAIHLVCNSDFDRIEIIEHVSFHHDEAGNTIHHDRIFQSYHIEPSATARTSSGCAEFHTDFTQGFTICIEQFSWEWTAADTGAVGFENAIYVTDS